MVLKLSDRSKDVIEPLMTPQWWMKMRELADEAIKVVQTGEITIFPLSEKKKYFRWMQDIDDWCVSRQLWWGHKAPAYVHTSIHFLDFTFPLWTAPNLEQWTAHDIVYYHYELISPMPTLSLLPH